MEDNVTRSPEGREPLHAEQILMDLAAGVGGATGEAFFSSLVQYLCRALKMDIALIGELADEAGTSIKTLAFSIDGRMIETTTYSLAGTPCDQVFGKKICSFPDRVAELFPQDLVLGELGAVSYVGSPLFDSGGRASGIISVLGRKPLERPDLAEATLEIFAVRAAAELERKKSEQKLRDRETFYRSLLESSFDGICAIDSKGRCTLLNPRGARILGYSSEQLIGQNFHSVVHPPGYCGSGCWMAHLNPEKKRQSGEDIFVNILGEAMPIEYAASLINGSESNGAVISFLQLTEKRQLEAQHEQSRRIQSLGHLAASVAHEFNNVLMGIQPFAEAIQQRADDQPKLSAAAAHITQSIRRGKRVTEEILRFARPSEPILKPIALGPLLHQLRSEIQRLMSDDVELQIEVADSLYVMGDTAQLQQALVNLASNARDAMPDGGLLQIVAQAGAYPRTPFSIERPERYVHIRIADNGIGIAPEALEHIFEPLFTTKHFGKGTGLGLAITHQIIEMHHGHILVESQLGKGTTFHLHIPVAPPPVQQEDRMHASLSPQRLLLVEDEAFIAEGLSGLLESEGHQVKTVNEGQKALAAVEGFAPTAVILDVGLPDIDGVELYEQLSSRWPGLPVIFSTGHGEESKLRHYLERPNVEFLLKPYDLSTLLKTLAGVLGY